jgi:O-acetyl-ADP-ribose deacetylase (regulator of RNase III)
MTARGRPKANNGIFMDQQERREFLIRSLLDERAEYRNMPIPASEERQKMLLRSLMNVRPPAPISDKFLSVQDEYLQAENESRGIVDLTTLTPARDGIYLWRGDITTLKCGAIVNAANSGMTGCYQPCHSCIDNCIHTYAGVELRNYCNDIMQRQGHSEPVGCAKITPAFNLPCDYVIHTVGPTVVGKLTQRHKDQLEKCYLSCLKIADENKVKSIAFCCISTGVFMFPNEEAARIAVDTVLKYRESNNTPLEVIFNVFKQSDERIYERLLKKS